MLKDYLYLYKKRFVLRLMKRNCLLLTLITIPIVVLLILTFLGFDGLYGQDSYEYIRYIERLKSFLLGGEYPGDLFWPKGYVLFVAFLSFILPTYFAAQIVSLICFYASFYFLINILKLLHVKSQNVYSFGIVSFLLAPYLLRLGVIVMSDSLAISCLLGASFFALKYSKKSSNYSILWACLLVSYGAFTRYAVIIPLIPIVIWVAILWIKSSKWSQILVLIIPCFLFWVHLYLEGNGSDFTEHHFINNWEILNLFRNQFVTEVALQIPNESYLFPNIIYYSGIYFYPGFFFLIGICVALYYKQFKKALKRFPLAFGLSIIFYTIFISGITYQSSRYATIAYPLFALFAFPFFDSFMKKLDRWKKPTLIFLVAIQLLLFIRAMSPTYQLNKLERNLAEHLEPYQNQTLYSFDVDIALQQRGLNFSYKSLWIEEYLAFEKNALVLFNEAKISSQFSGKNPMINWNRVKDRLILVEELGQGWNLYRINE